MRGIVERFEGEHVVIEFDGIMKDISKTDVDDVVRIGDVVVLKDGKWVTNEKETKSRTQKINKLMNQVWED